MHQEQASFQAIIALGSNIGDSKTTLNEAVTHISKVSKLTHQSSVIQTKACYVTDQPDFLNQVIIVLTALPLEEFFSFLQDLEKKLGRTPTFHHGPRVIDIDLLYYQNEIVNTPHLTLPHPGVQERLFVLEPLCEIMPEWVCPLTGVDMKTALDNLKASQL